MGREFHGRKLCSRKKRGNKVGKTKKGKGTKWVVVADGKGIPLGGDLIASASSAEITLADETLAQIKVPRACSGRPKSRPKRLIADKGYDCDAFRKKLKKRGIEVIVPYRKNRKSKKQDGRKLRRYKKRGKVERTFSWIGNFRRLVVRYERHSFMYRAFFYLACILVTLRF